MRCNPPTSPLIALFLRFIALLALFLLTRFIFFWFNHDAFSAFTAPVFWQGLRFDAAAICLLNTPYFLLLLLPFPFVESRAARTIGNVYFILVNSIALLTNLTDACYYPFSMRRMTGDIFSFIGETNNFGELVPVFLKDYWYVGVIWLALVACLFLTVYLTDSKAIHKFTIKGWGGHLIIRAFCAFLIVVGMRGGLQMRPLNISYAGTVAGVENAALVLNSPYSLITTLGTDGVGRIRYFSDEECAEIFGTRRHFDSFPADSGRPANIVLIILEGISSEYSGYLADEPKALAGFTPFLDSLAKNAIVFRGYANGQQSIEALSSILGGIPSLMDKPFSQSPYAVNDVHYAVKELSKNGMRTMFFHGGKNGTMGFDRYCRISGIDRYFGMDEYPDEKDFDGTWGIKDIPYLQYVANELGKDSSPFFATVFTLSSHHPFVVPDGYDTILPKGSTPMQQCVAYTDEALRQFFEQAKKSRWYENTLFVITADHTNFYGAENVGYLEHRYSVPMIFYWPKNSVSYRSDRIVQQVDIMPSIFDFCKLDGTFTSFGHSAFDETAPHFAINYLSGNYQFYTDHFLFEFDGGTNTHIWDLQGGNHNVDAQAVPDFSEREQLMKAVIQRYNNGLLDNNW